jgi:hypothetical protein
MNQPLVALANSEPRHTKAQSWHTQFELDTFLAQGRNSATVIRKPTLSAIVQLLGALLLVVAVLTHTAETLRVLPEMGWGRPAIPGHYLAAPAQPDRVAIAVEFLQRALPLRALDPRRGFRCALW